MTFGYFLHNWVFFCLDVKSEPLIWKFPPEVAHFCLDPGSRRSPPSSGWAACVPPRRWRRQPVLPWCRGSGAVRSQPRTRVGDGVTRRGAASHPQAGSGQERRGGEEEPADGVQVGIPHIDLSFNDREDETASGSLTADLLSEVVLTPSWF